MQYSKANTDEDFESQESLLSDERVSHLHQNGKSATKWRHIFLISLYLLGTAMACLAAGLVGYHWQRDLDGICTSHVSETCKLFSLLATAVTDRTSSIGEQGHLP